MSAGLRTEFGGDGIAVLTLARPARRNALSLALIAAMRAALDRARGARAIVIAGEGAVFSAGADFADLSGGAGDADFDAAMSDLTAALEAGPAISIAAIHGPCVGAGLDLALACDFRLAGPGARFSLPAVRMGILYNPSRLTALAGRLAPATLRRLLLLAEDLGPEAALAGGIVTHLGPAAGTGPLLEAALDLARTAAALPPQAQRAARDFLRAVDRPDYDADAWQARRMELLASEERRAALLRAKGQKP